MTKYLVGDLVVILNNDTGAEHPVGSVGSIIHIEADEDGVLAYQISVGGDEWWHASDEIYPYIGQNVRHLILALERIAKLKASPIQCSCKSIASDALSGWTNSK